MQLRHLPRSKSGTKYHAPNPGRPVPMNDMPIRPEVEQKFFPDGVDRVQPCVADYSIPTLEAIHAKIGNESTKRLFQLLESQTVFEKLAWAETESSVDSLGHAQESVPPAAVHEFQAARLFLSHFGFLTINNDDDEQGSGGGGSGGGGVKQADDSLTTAPPPAVPLLTVLDTKRPGFAHDLQLLDKLSPRTNDTLHVFYVRAGQSTAAEIVENMNEPPDENAVDGNFWNILMSLGWPVSVAEHAGWTGFLTNSWRIKVATKSNGASQQQTSGRFNGEQGVLYWADVGAEIAFVVPTKWNKCDDCIPDGSCLSSSSSAAEGGTAHPGGYERSVSVMPQTGPNKTPIGQKPRTLSLELDKGKSSSSSSSSSTSHSADPIAPSRRRAGTSKPPLLGQIGAKIMLVWLESFEDYLTFPIGNNVPFL